MTAFTLSILLPILGFIQESIPEHVPDHVSINIRESTLLLIAEYATIFTTIIVCTTTILIFFKKVRKWLSNSLANHVTIENLSQDSDMLKLINKYTSYENTFKEIELAVLSGEILRYMDFHPDDKKMIYEMVDKYKKLGGNSYMCDVIKNWEKGQYPSVISKMQEVMANHLDNCPYKESKPMQQSNKQSNKSKHKTTKKESIKSQHNTDKDIE